MTQDEKRRIEELRGSGLGYAKIAKTLDISENTVKSYCRRLTAPTAIAADRCAQCGKSIDRSKRSNKRFCSDTCRMKWWNRHPKPGLTYTAVCACCGKEFQMWRRNYRKYCSRQCYIKGRFGERHD